MLAILRRMQFPATLGRDLLVWGFFWSVYSRLQPGAEDELLAVAGCSAVPLLMLVSFVLDQYPRHGGSVVILFGFAFALFWTLAVLHGVLDTQPRAGPLWRFVLFTFLAYKTAFDLCVWALRLEVR